MKPPHSIPSLQSTLAKRTKPTLKPNFAKEPFSPSRSEAVTKQHCSSIESLVLLGRPNPAYNN